MINKTREEDSRYTFTISMVYEVVSFANFTVGPIQDTGYSILYYLILEKFTMFVCLCVCLFFRCQSYLRNQ